MNIIKKIQVDGVDYDIQSNELTKVTYAELKEMRDNGSLAAGHLYRITDYEFTTKQFKTKSAGNVFDIIVLATSENQLSELARAIQHEGDTYFDGSDLGAWELWYDLDNNAEKHYWADAENGKGVIYRMIDERRNDCPYDFKNALFYNTQLTTDTTTDQYYYTFSYVVSGKLYDGTVEKQTSHCSDNSMGVYINTYRRKSLNSNVLRNTSFGSSCYSNTFGDNCDNNTFGNSCYSNTFGNACYSNTFGNSCYYNTFGNSCNYNTFGNNCTRNTFGNNFAYQTFGDSFNRREVNYGNTSITLNDEYYDDGSGQLVPIKHPDLSTQPSILPYKFMGQYVYEQLIPVSEEDVSKLKETNCIILDISSNSCLTINNLILLESTLIIAQLYSSPQEGYPSTIQPAIYPVTVYTEHGGVNNPQPQYLHVISNDSTSMSYTPYISYLRLVYTSMPEEGGDYYGYNNY